MISIREHCLALHKLIDEISSKISSEEYSNICAEITTIYHADISHVIDDVNEIIDGLI